MSEPRSFRPRRARDEVPARPHQRAQPRTHRCSRRPRAVLRQSQRLSPLGHAARCGPDDDRRRSPRCCSTGQAGGRSVRGAAFIAHSRRAYTDTALRMQPITCDACRQPTLAHDVVNYGSMEGGYRQLCGRCFNEAAASRLGLQGFEHVVFEPVRMVDGHGTEHEFRFRTRLFGPGVAIDAFELRDGCPTGYEFQVIGEPDDDPLELLGKLIGKMRRALALTHLEDTDHGPQINDRLILRGTSIAMQTRIIVCRWSLSMVARSPGTNSAVWSRRSGAGSSSWSFATGAKRSDSADAGNRRVQSHRGAWDEAHQSARRIRIARKCRKRKCLSCNGFSEQSAPICTKSTTTPVPASVQA